MLELQCREAVELERCPEDNSSEYIRFVKVESSKQRRSADICSPAANDDSNGADIGPGHQGRTVLATSYMEVTMQKDICWVEPRGWPTAVGITHPPGGAQLRDTDLTRRHNSQSTCYH